MSTESGQRERVARMLRDLQESATLISALLGAIGIVAYVLLSYLCSWLYAPLSVNPSEVGLNQGALLLRAASGVVGFILVVATISLTVVFGSFMVLELWSKRQRFAAGALAAVLVVGGPVVLLGSDTGWKPWEDLTGLVVLELSFVCLAIGGWSMRRGETWMPLLGIVAALLGWGVLLLVDSARTASGQIQRGERPDELPFGIPAPWNAEVARVTWAASKPPEGPKLPRCVLYLGNEAGTSVLYDATSPNRTLRMSTSNITIEVLPDARRCGPLADQ